MRIMIKDKYLILSLVSFLILGLFLYVSAFSQTPPASQTAGGLEQQKKQIEKEKRLREKVEKKKKKPEIEEKRGLKKAELPKGERVLIKEITVEGFTLVSSQEIEKIISPFENKNLALKDMQKIADLITDLYRQKGYLTSRAYLPPQRIKVGRLLIRIVEGKKGILQIRGNRYFKTSLLERKIGLKEGDPFNYQTLQKSLTSINEHPDREAKLVLSPGKEPGATDIILEVTDRLPIHVGFEYDNYGSRYIEKDRYAVVFQHNNLLGFDDKLYFKFQKSESSWHRFKTARYLFPVNDTLELGGYFSRSSLKLGREFKDVDARGKATLIGLFLNKALLTTENMDLRFNFGFDYKHIRNYLLGVESSRDEVRVFKGGFDLDVTDKLGRTLLTSELDVGVPRMFGGLASKDPQSSRGASGAGGKFVKGVFNLFRLQSMPFSTAMLWKTSAQYSNYSLVASEEFQIGGATSVRGYPPAEHAADKGIYTSLEWSIPAYFIPKNLRVPFTKEKIYDALRFVLFYDWATTHLNRVLAGEKQHRTLKGWGFGLRFNLKDYLSIRVELGYPLDDTPSDEDHVHPWIKFTWRL